MAKRRTDSKNPRIIRLAPGDTRWMAARGGLFAQPALVIAVRLGKNASERNMAFVALASGRTSWVGWSLLTEKNWQWKIPPP